MNHPLPGEDDLERALLDLDALHEREATVLRSMDRDALEAVTTEKELLFERLREAMGRQAPEERHRLVLDRLRRRATINQLLIVHARDAVRTILSQVSGAPVDALPGARKAVVQDGVRVNWRG